MSIDFQKIEAHPVDIENFSYDVSEMVDNIYIGPQGDLLEKVIRFNRDYNTDIGITKSFTLKPGGYDKLKKAYTDWILRWDMKPRGVKSIFDRVSQYAWRLSGFRSQILTIENAMKDLKASGMRWQDNTEQFDVEYNRVKTSIINALDKTRQLYPDIEILCKIIPTDRNRLHQARYRNSNNSRDVFPEMFTESTVDFVLTFYIKLTNPTMTTFVMDDSTQIDEYKHTIGDVLISSGTYLLPLISRHWGRTTPMTANPSISQYSWFLEAIYMTPMKTNSHPYIGYTHDKYFYEMGGEMLSGSLCTGNMGNDMRNSLLNNEIMAHITYLITWVTNYYVPQTNPLNRISQTRRTGHDITMIGWANDLNSSSREVFGQTNLSYWYDCSLSKDINSSMIEYAKGQNRIYNYIFSSTAYNQNDAEYPLRLEEWINRVDVQDLPCLNCEFQSDCQQYNMLLLLLQDYKSPEEEGILGILYELYTYDMKIGNQRERDSNIIIFFVEMSIGIAWRYKLMEEYDLLILSHRCCQRWAQVNGETFNIIGNRYHQRMRILRCLPTKELTFLYEQHCKDDSEFVWTLDGIRDFRLPRFMRKDNEVNELEDDTIHAWLHQEEPNRDLPEELVIEEDSLTSEQRTLQWATRAGGSTNL